MNLVYSLTSVQSYTHTPFHPHLSPSPSPSSSPSFLLLPSPPLTTLPLSYSPTSSPTLPINPIHPLKYPQSPQSPKPTKSKESPDLQQKSKPKKPQNLPLSKSTNPTPPNFPPWIKHQNPSLGGNSNSQIPPTIRLENLTRENFHQRHFRCKSARCGR